jgi:hypothetical protein
MLSGSPCLTELDISTSSEKCPLINILENEFSRIFLKTSIKLVLKLSLLSKSIRKMVINSIKRMVEIKRN